MCCTGLAVVLIVVARLNVSTGAGAGGLNRGAFAGRPTFFALFMLFFLQRTETKREERGKAKIFFSLKFSPFFAVPNPNPNFFCVTH